MHTTDWAPLASAAALVPVLGWSLLALGPFLWMLSTSVKQPDQIFTYPPQWLPSPATFEHYQYIIERTPFPRFFLNSVVVAVAVTCGQLVSSILAAFAFARLSFPGRDALFVVFLGTLMIPDLVTYVPLFMVVRFMGLVDTYPGLILPSLVTPFGIFLLRQAFMAAPRDLEDAARIDGCGPWRTLWSVFLPIARPAVATATLFAFLQSWNAYFWPLIVTQSTQMRTAAVGLRYFVRDPELGTNWGVLMAASTLILIPIVVLFLATQRQFIQGLLAGSMKG